jgi:hypothetical protein
VGEVEAEEEKGGSVLVGFFFLSLRGLVLVLLVLVLANASTQRNPTGKIS